MILRGNFFSQKLQMETHITIVAPDRFSALPNKVIYLLHGLCGRSGDWLEYTTLPAYSKDYQAIFVMPEVARSFYSDMKYGLDYFSYVTDELPAICKSVFNISARREDTGIIGASMGGYGALKSALSKPEQYGFCGAISSPCLMLKEHLAYSGGATKFKELFGEHLMKDFQAIFGESIAWNPKEDVIELAKQLKNRTANPDIYLACGKEDSFYDDNVRFQAMLQELGHTSFFDDWHGNHDWTFFDEALKRTLGFFLGKTK